MYVFRYSLLPYMFGNLFTQNYNIYGYEIGRKTVYIFKW